MVTTQLAIISGEKQNLRKQETMTELAVITNQGDVFGSTVNGTELGPVFQFSGAKIGFNPQDRFMVAMGNTLLVITQDGSVFGASVAPGTTELEPVLQFGGAKIGFNPQDRFMVTIGNTLAVITQSGDVFGAVVESQTSGGIIGQPQSLDPVFQFGGAKIGFNPQDRFMVTIGNTLAVITQSGDVFGAAVDGQNIDPVFQLSGAKIGFNPEDRFMVASDLLMPVIP